MSNCVSCKKEIQKDFVKCESCAKIGVESWNLNRNENLIFGYSSRQIAGMQGMTGDLKK